MITTVSVILWFFLSGEQIEHGERHGLEGDDAARVGQSGNDAVVTLRHHRVTVDLQDAVAEAKAGALGQSAAQQRANDAVLNGEAQGAAHVGAPQTHLQHGLRGEHCMEEEGVRVRGGGGKEERRQDKTQG